MLGPFPEENIQMVVINCTHKDVGPSGLAKGRRNQKCRKEWKNDEEQKGQNEITTLPDCLAQKRDRISFC